MATSYNVYANDGNGGKVNYQTPIASTSALSQAVGPLAAPSNNSFAVRAFDTTSGIEEANTDAQIRIVIDPAGNDVTARPNAVVGLSVTPTAGGTCWVSWGYDTTGQGGPPLSFQLTLTAATSPSTANPAATIAYLPGVSGYGCSLSGLVGNTPYTIILQAIGGSSLLVSPVTSIPMTYQATLLSGVDSLVATPMP